MSKEIGAYINEDIEQNGPPTSLEDAYLTITNANERLMFDRHRKYGAGNISKFGLSGVAIRTSDKLERLITMVFNDTGDNGVEETVEDTLGDISNYGIIGILVQRGWWNLPQNTD